MASSSNRPKAGVIVSTYSELDQFVRQFAADKFGLLILTGSPGLQKTQIVRSILGPEVCWFESNTTAFGMYCRLVECRDRPVVIDDVDSLYADRAAVRLLKSLCQTERSKSIAWDSDPKTLQQRNIPRQFVTESRVLIIANNWRTLNMNVRALEDRGHVLSFEPPALEVHRRTAQWFTDQEIFDFIGQHLHRIARLSMRHYILGRELKEAGLDWKRFLLERCQFTPNEILVAKLKADPSYATEEDRAQAFVHAGGGCRTTYFNYVKKLQPADAPPRILLENGLQAKLDVLEVIERQYPQLGAG